MIGLVMLQKSEGGGLGMGGGSGFLTSRGTSNVLTRGTAILAAVFFVTSLVLSMLAGYDRRPTSIFQGGAPTSQPAAPGGSAPLGNGGGGILNQLQRPSAPAPAQPAAPAKPAEPQVPRSQ
jgi:preprotein translocase subunit SecG